MAKHHEKDSKLHSKDTTLGTLHFCKCWDLFWWLGCCTANFWAFYIVFTIPETFRPSNFGWGAGTFGILFLCVWFCMCVYVHKELMVFMIHDCGHCVHLLFSLCFTAWVLWSHFQVDGALMKSCLTCTFFCNVWVFYFFPFAKWMWTRGHIPAERVDLSLKERQRQQDKDYIYVLDRELKQILI